jgi:hypothetical protein
MSNIKDLTVAQLMRVIEIRGQIEKLQAQLDSIGTAGKVGRPPKIVSEVAATPRKEGRRHMSAAGRARIAAAAKARWAKYRGEADAPAAKKSVKTKKRFNAAARAKLSAAAKARWANAKASGKSTL